MLTGAEDELLRANETFYRAFAARDIEGMDALWANVADVACVHPGWPALHGREEVMESWRSILLGEGAPEIICEDPRAIVLGETGHVTCLERLSDGSLVATNLFVRENGLWLLAHHHAGPLTEFAELPPDELVN